MSDLSFPIQVAQRYQGSLSGGSNLAHAALSCRSWVDLNRSNGRRQGDEALKDQGV